MIAILLYSLLFIFGLIYALSIFPPSKNFISLFFQSFFHDQKNPPQQQNDQPLMELTTFNTNTNNTTTTKADLRGVFATFDKNDDGYITRHELRESLKNIGIAVGERDVVDMVEKVDSNGDGLIDFDEFRELFDSMLGGGGGGGDKEEEEKGHEEEEGNLKEAFDVFDGNKDGLITVDELGLVLSCLGFTEGKKAEDCKEMIRKVDMDGDGMVNFDEFKRMMKSGLGRIVQVS